MEKNNLKFKAWYFIYTVIIYFFFIIPSCFALEPLQNELQVSSDKRPLFKNIHGYFDLNGYYDTRSFDIITNNTLINLPYGLHYYSFTNLLGPFNSADSFTLNKYYTEQNIRWALYKNIPVELNVQWNSGSNLTDKMRFGPRIRVNDLPWIGKILKKLNLIYAITPFPLQVDHSKGYDAQIEQFYKMQVLPRYFKDRVYISGFADINFLYGSDNRTRHHPSVTETQLGIRLINQVYAVVEYRYNGFLPTNKRNGLGLGLEYLFKF